MEPDPLDLVLVERAPDAVTAQLIAGLLRSAGIPAQIGGEALVDEWAVSQKALGLLAVEVRVPRSRLDEARQLLAARQAPGWTAVGEEPETAGSSGLPAADPGPPPVVAPRRLLAFEVAVVLLLLVAPSGSAWVAGLVWGRQALPPPTMSEFVLHDLVRSTGVIALLLFLMLRSGQALGRYGLVRYRWVVDPLVALGLLTLIIPLEVMAAAGAAPPVPIYPAPDGRVEVGLWVVAQLVDVFSQELAIRGYLIPRLQQLLGSTWKSVAASAAFYSLWHFYQGPERAAALLVEGLILGAVFASMRRLWPLVLAHAFWNVVIASW